MTSLSRYTDGAMGMVYGPNEDLVLTYFHQGTKIRRSGL